MIRTVIPGSPGTPIGEGLSACGVVGKFDDAQIYVGIANASVHSLTLLTGSGYTSAPSISLVGGGGTNATATAGLGTDGAPTLYLTAGGSGYTSDFTVTLSAPQQAIIQTSARRLFPCGQPVSIGANENLYIVTPAVDANGNLIPTGTWPDGRVVIGRSGSTAALGFAFGFFV